jgi:hypothetical protein
MVGWACTIAPRPALAQAAADTPAKAVPAGAATGGAEAARGERFVNAVRSFTATGNIRPAGASAFLMVDIPNNETPPSGERTISIEFRDIRAETLAKFYADACGPDGPRIERRCALRQLTITTTQELAADTRLPHPRSGAAGCMRTARVTTVDPRSPRAPRFA